MNNRLISGKTRLEKIYCDDSKKISTIRQVYLYILVFVAIYIEWGYAMVVSDRLSGTMRTAVLLGLIATTVVSIKNTKKNRGTFLLFFWLSLIIAVNIMFVEDKGNYILLFIPMLLGFLVSITVDIKNLIRVFVNIMTFLAAYSLMIYATSILFPGIIDRLPFLGYRFGEGVAIKDAFFSVCITNAQNLRNYGIAWEPGAFALLLCVALFCSMAFYKKTDFRKSIIITIAIITTFSTMGYIVMFVIYLVTMQKGGKKNKNKASRVFGIAVATMALMLILPAELRDLVFSKLEGLFNDSKDLAYTTQSRLDAIKYPMEAFYSSPLLGVGYDEFAFINKFKCNGVATNTIVNWFAVMGLLFGLPCAYGYINCIVQCGRYLKLKGLNIWLLIIASILLVSTESLLRISFIYVLVFYGAQKNVLMEEIRESE